MAAYKDIKSETEKRKTLELPFLKELFRQSGHPKSLVVTTENMTQEEEEIEVTAGFLKEGYPYDKAEKKAKEWVRIINSL